MNTSELLKKINEVCFAAKKRKLDTENSMSRMDNEKGGFLNGEANMADEIIELLKEYGNSSVA